MQTQHKFVRFTSELGRSVLICVGTHFIRCVWIRCVWTYIELGGLSLQLHLHCGFGFRQQIDRYVNASGEYPHARLFNTTHMRRVIKRVSAFVIFSNIDYLVKTTVYTFSVEFGTRIPNTAFRRLQSRFADRKGNAHTFVCDFWNYSEASSVTYIWIKKNTHTHQHQKCTHRKSPPGTGTWLCWTQTASEFRSPLAIRMALWIWT